MLAPASGNCPSEGSSPQQAVRGVAGGIPDEHLMQQPADHKGSRHCDHAAGAAEGRRGGALPVHQAACEQCGEESAWVVSCEAGKSRAGWNRAVKSSRHTERPALPCRRPPPPPPSPFTHKRTFHERIIHCGAQQPADDLVPSLVPKVGRGGAEVNVFKVGAERQAQECGHAGADAVGRDGKDHYVGEGCSAGLVEKRNQ